MSRMQDGSRPGGHLSVQVLQATGVGYLSERGEVMMMNMMVVLMMMIMMMILMVVV